MTTSVVYNYAIIR